MRSWGLQLFQCVTPLHNGAGQGLGLIDRPVVREVATRIPYVQSSTVKGAYHARAAGTKKWVGLVDLAFGGPADKDGARGALTFTDASLLALPVRSLAGTFVLATSRLILGRLEWLLDVAGVPPDDRLRRALREALGETRYLRGGMAAGPSQPSSGERGNGRWDSVVRLEGSGPYVAEGLILRDLPDASGAAGVAVADLAGELVKWLVPDDGDGFWRAYLRGRLLVLDDDDFAHLVEHATQVEAGIKIGAKGTTDEGLRYSEYLPTETVLAALVGLEERPGEENRLSKVWQNYGSLAGQPVQLGADESKGRGIARSSWKNLYGPVPASPGKIEEGGHAG